MSVRGPATCRPCPTGTSPVRVLSTPDGEVLAPTDPIEVQFSNGIVGLNTKAFVVFPTDLGISDSIRGAVSFNPLTNTAVFVPSWPLPVGEYTGSISGVTDVVGRFIPPVDFNFSVCFAATLSGTGNGTTVTVDFNAAVTLTALSVRNPSNVETNLTPVPAFGTAAKEYVAPYATVQVGTYHVSATWTNPGGCVQTGTFTFHLAS